MLKLLTDAEIQDLITERKLRPADLLPITRLVDRNQHRRREYPVSSASDTGNEFMIAVRQSLINPLDFSAILGYKVPGTTTIFRLRRYNGTHEHTNAIERETINDFHIHQATERYQRRGAREDSFAWVSNGHHSLESAVRSLLHDCGFDNVPSDSALLPFPPPVSE